MLEKCLIEYCSPTLASLKTANLFNYSLEAGRDVADELFAVNCGLSEKGLFAVELRRSGGKALIYVWRRSFLERDLGRPDVRCFLEGYGYRKTDMVSALMRLKEHLAENESFPHEIGVFLGYPLGDVIGFIRNAGKNSKCSGWWKVYCDECEAQKQFARFQKCRDIYTKLWSEGRSVWQLTVAA